MVMASNGHFWINGRVSVKQVGVRKSYLDANTAPDAEFLGNRCHFAVGGHLDAQFPHSHYGTGFLALLAASLRLAFVGVYDRNTCEFVGFFGRSSARHVLQYVHFQ